MKNNSVNLIVVLGILLLVMGGFIAYLNGASSSRVNSATTSRDNVTLENNIQYIDIQVRGGYSPGETVAKANTPTTLRMNTQNTFDCSLALMIPKINYRKTLLTTGVEEIEMPPQKSGSVVTGTCSMGMYGFRITFE